jgi:hypothetical protein
MKVLTRVGLAMVLLAMLMVAMMTTMLRAHASDGNAQVTGGSSHKMAMENRSISAEVAVVNLKGPVDMILKQGSTASLTVSGEESMLPLVKTEQKGDTLTIDVKETFMHMHRPLRIEMTLPALRELSSQGSGDSIVSGFNGEQLKLDLHGSGDVRFNGNYRSVNASTMGSGDIDLNLIESNDVNLTIMGSGGINTSGNSKSLTAHLMGSGDLGAEKMIADTVNLAVLGSGDSNIYARQVAILDLKGSGDISVHGNPTRREVSRFGSGDVNWE